MARNGLKMRLFVGRWRCLAGWVATGSERGAVGCGTPTGTREVQRMQARQVDQLEQLHQLDLLKMGNHR